jgi:cytoskeletal protein RodZ
MKKRNQNAKSAFGRYLQRKRLSERISLADVSKKTRIRIQTLLAIEKEEHHKLPADTYVKGLLRNFARAVEADEEQAVQRYEQSRKEISAEAQFESRLKKYDAGSWLKLIISLGLMLLLVTVSIYLMTWLGSEAGTEPSLHRRGEEVAINSSIPERCPAIARTDKPSVDGNGDNPGALTSIATHPIREEHANNTFGEDKIQLDTKSTSPRADGEMGYLLSIHVITDTWLKVIADDQEAVKYQLKAGDRLDLTAFTRFNILIGNARGVRLFVNDRPFPVIGKSGQIVNINIP